MEVFLQFGELDEETLKLHEYAKYKAAQINKALRNGETPGLSEGDLENELENFGTQQSMNGSNSIQFIEHNMQIEDNSTQLHEEVPDVPNTFENDTKTDMNGGFPKVPSFSPPPRNPYQGFPEVPRFTNDIDVDNDNDTQFNQDENIDNFNENMQNMKNQIQPNFGQPPQYPITKNNQNQQRNQNTQNSQPTRNNQQPSNQQPTNQQPTNQQNTNNQQSRNNSPIQNQQRNQNTQPTRNNQQPTNQQPTNQQPRNNQQNNQQSRNNQQRSGYGRNEEYVPQQSYGTFSPSMNDIYDSQKYAKYVISSLQFEDVPAAVENLYICLKILTGIDHKSLVNNN